MLDAPREMRCYLVARVLMHLHTRQATWRCRWAAPHPATDMFSYRAASLLFLMLLAASQEALAQQEDIYSLPLQAERSRTYDALHYRVHLIFDEPTKSFRGTNTITLSPLQDDFRQADLDAETFIVDAVTDAEGGALAFEQEPHRLMVHFPEPYAYGDTARFTVAYHALQVDIDSEAYGVSPTYDLGIDFKDASEDHPQLINTLSFPRGARHWMPCYDHPNDRASHETLLTVRSGYKALSNGRLVSVREEDGGFVTYHWLQELPHPTYLYVAVAGPYVVLEDSLGSLPVNYWVYPKDVDDAMRSFERTPEILQFLSGVYGVDYPWVKYDQITIPGIGGGAESTTATVLGQSTIHDADAEQDFPSDGLVAHEAAHQWWGNLVSYRDWPQTWLSESFATYSEYLWARHAHGPDEGALNLLGKKESYFREAADRYQRPIVFHRWRYPNDNFDRHTYQKGAVVLGMLREVMGEGPFLRAIAHFLQKHAYEAVDTHDLMIAIKDATGQNLDWFFDQWIFGASHPVLQISREWDEAAEKLHLTVEQIQEENLGVFRMPVTVKIVTASEESSYNLWLDERLEKVSFPLTGKPLMVRFDEGNHLLAQWSFMKSTEELLYQLVHDDAMGRRWAALQLGARLDEPAVIEALRRSAEHDAFWHVRAASIEELGALADLAHVPFFQARSMDAHSKVREAALGALGGMPSAGLVDFLKARFEEDDSYVARAAALRALGSSGDKNVRPFLEEAMRIKSPRDVIGNAAQWALEQL